VAVNAKVKLKAHVVTDASRRRISSRCIPKVPLLLDDQPPLARL
jgi:hypothetical protein